MSQKITKTLKHDITNILINIIGKMWNWTHLYNLNVLIHWWLKDMNNQTVGSHPDHLSSPVSLEKMPQCRIHNDPLDGGQCVILTDKSNQQSQSLGDDAWMCLLVKGQEQLLNQWERVIEKLQSSEVQSSWKYQVSSWKYLSITQTTHLPNVWWLPPRVGQIQTVSKSEHQVWTVLEVHS